jgi:hypothetical protein
MWCASVFMCWQDHTFSFFIQFLLHPPPLASCHHSASSWSSGEPASTFHKAAWMSDVSYEAHKDGCYECLWMHQRLPLAHCWMHLRLSWQALLENDLRMVAWQPTKIEKT